jgi:hypothetical protein
LILSVSPPDGNIVLAYKVIDEVERAGEILSFFLGRVVASDEYGSLVVAVNLERNNLININQQIMEVCKML